MKVGGHRSNKVTVSLTYGTVFAEDITILNTISINQYKNFKKLKKINGTWREAITSKSKHLLL